MAHIRDIDTGHGVALCQRLPGAFACRADGDIEAIAIRNATRERAFGFVPMLGMPATGHERSAYGFDYAVVWTEQGDWRENNILGAAHDMWPALARDRDLWVVSEYMADRVTTDCPDVDVAAVKYADRGDGVVVRLRTGARVSAPVAVRVRGRPVTAAFECDARERDLAPVVVRDGAAMLAIDGPIITVRLLF
jgi:hypothetical protein